MRTLKTYRVYVVKKGHKDIPAYDVNDLQWAIGCFSSLDFDWDPWEVDDIEKLPLQPTAEAAKREIV